jgi:peptidoglycan/LPS O-acetylase OafA/YrhL
MALWSTAMHGPSTTVQAEIMAVPFILVAWILRRKFGIALLALAFVYSVLAIVSAVMIFYLPNMHIYLFAFIAGMLLAEPMLKPLIAQAPAGTWWIALIGLVFCRTFESSMAITSLIAMVLAAAILVAGLLHGRRSSLTVLLERPIVQALGRASFSFYLLSVLVLDLIWSFTDRWSWPQHHALEAGLIVGVLAIALTWPLAWVSERWVERPSIAASRWVWSVLRAPLPNRIEGLPTRGRRSSELTTFLVGA